MKPIATFFFLLLLTSCVRFQTNVDRSAIPPFTRVLVVSKMPVTQPDFTRFLSVFPEQYEVCLAEAGTLALASPDSIINNQARTCRSEVILSFKLNRTYTSGNGDLIQSVDELLLEMTDTRTGHTFWKALTAGRVVPYRTVLQLSLDGIIEGKVRRPPAATY